MPGAGGTQRLPRRIGAARALELTLLGSVIDAGRALELGLVNRVAPAGAALEEAVALAERLAALSAVAVRAIKASITSAGELPLARGLDRERELFMGVFNSADAQEGVQAFIGKRRPVFRHM